MRGRKINLSCEDCKSRTESKFGSLCSHELSNISLNKSCTSYKKGQVLFHEGTRPLGVFCINQGKIKVYKTGYDGKDQIIQIAKNGDLLGYRAMISEESYPVSAEALEEAQVCFLPKSEFIGLLDSNSDFNHLILKEACKELGVMTENMTNLAQKSVRERLAVALLMLKDTYGLNGHNDGPVEINLTREDLANIVGTATETIIRLLHDFKDEKVIETQGRKIRVIDSKKLVRIGNIY